MPARFKPSSWLHWYALSNGWSYQGESVADFGRPCRVRTWSVFLLRSLELELLTLVTHLEFEAMRQCCVHGKFLWNFSLPPKIKAPTEGRLLVESPSEARVKGSSSSRKKNTNGCNCLLHELSVTLHVKWPIHGICDACMARGHGHGFIENSRKNALTNALSISH